MNLNQHTLSVFGVHDVRDISLTSLFANILSDNDWLHRDCYHWLDGGNLVIVNTKELARLTFQIESGSEYVCIQSATVHRSLPF